MRRYSFVSLYEGFPGFGITTVVECLKCCGQCCILRHALNSSCSGLEIMSATTFSTLFGVWSGPGALFPADMRMASITSSSVISGHGTLSGSRVIQNQGSARKDHVARPDL